jgi:uncharacterized membrane protein YphA (DoxX/SURF4 family)
MALLVTFEGLVRHLYDGTKGLDVTKPRAIGYWTTTTILALTLLSGGVAQMLGWHEAVEGVVRLGYPAYVVTIIGVWKLLGGIAVLVPRFPRLKEWAYAGVIIDLTGASISSAASDVGIRHVVTPLVLAIIALASWALRPEGRRLAS